MLYLQIQLVREINLVAWSRSISHILICRMRNKRISDKDDEKERARMLEEFWQRKREAAENKARVAKAVAAPPQQVCMSSILVLYRTYNWLMWM